MQEQRVQTIWDSVVEIERHTDTVTELYKFDYIKKCCQTFEGKID